MEKKERLLATLRDSERIHMGSLPCPTGCIVVCDPFFCGTASPLQPCAPPGQYQVILHRMRVPGFGSRIAAAQLEVQQAEIVDLSPAVLPDGSPTHYFVDSGLGSFMDEGVRLQFAEVVQQFGKSTPEANYYWDVLEREFRANAADPANPYDAGDYCMHAFAATPNSQVAMFSSGLGDGQYASHWGLDAGGERVALVTSFKVFSSAGGAPRSRA